MQNVSKLKPNIYLAIFVKPNKIHNACVQQQQTQIVALYDNLDVLTSKAEKNYYDGDFDGAYVLCRRY